MKSLRSCLAFLAVGSLIACLGLGILAAQKIPGLGNIKKKIETFSLSRFLEEEPPVSTSLDDAVTEIPFLDDFNPPDPAPMAALSPIRGMRFACTDRTAKPLASP
jgi:hypothetical protein